MYLATHAPTVCNSRAHPTICQSCHQQVFYFFCDHGSKVFFDELGEGWPEHSCGQRMHAVSEPGESRPSGRVAWSQLAGVTFSVQQPGSALMPGMARGSIQMTIAAIRRVSEARFRSRETMRMEPLGSHPEVLVGRVTNAHRVPLDRKSGLEDGSLGLRMIGEHFPRLDAVQLTILVDEIDIDPEAEDLFSYTFLCPVSEAADSVEVNDIVKVDIRPLKLPGLGRRWVATALELL